MISIGEKLKASREEKGISLKEVSEDLKISVKDLENIEAGNRNAFQDVFILREYIRDYAKYLGFDYENLIDEFNEYMFEYTSKIPTDVIERISKQKEKEEEKKGSVSPYTKINKSKINQKTMIYILIILLIILVIVIATVLINSIKISELMYQTLM